uniref:Uncharacterized protein n=1 Tax=Arundo donax TaxID=35708 RepID=A0A0A9DJC3_ARUDO
MKLYKNEYVMTNKNTKKKQNSKPRRKGSKKRKVIEPIVPISYYPTSGRRTSGTGKSARPPHPHHPVIFFLAIIAALIFLFLQCHHQPTTTPGELPAYHLAATDLRTNNGGQREQEDERERETMRGSGKSTGCSWHGGAAIYLAHWMDPLLSL